MLRRSLTPLMILIVIACLDMLSYFELIPSKAVAFDAVSTWLSTNGILFVGLLAFLENVAIANVYFPGSVAILAAMHGASGDVGTIMTVWIVVTVFGLVGQTTTYLLASTVFAKLDVTKKGIEELRPWTLAFGSYWHPHLASMTCLTFASSGLPLRKFLVISLAASSAWNAFWTLFVLSFGNIFAEGPMGSVLVYSYLIVWILLSVGSGQTSKPK